MRRFVERAWLYAIMAVPVLYVLVRVVGELLHRK